MKRAGPWVARIGVVLGATLLCVGLNVVPDVSATSSIPNAPTDVVATPSSTSTDVIVTWQFSTSGVTPDRALVIAFQGSTDVGQVTCAYPICTSMDVPGLSPEYSYTFKVKAGTAAGYSA